MALDNIQRKRLIWAALTVILFIIIDQTVKFLVKTNMQLYESIDVLSWFKISFTENAGMAFGIELLNTNIQAILRFIVACFVAYYIYELIQRNFKFGYIFCIAMILAGAFGNIIDNAFYGLIFDHSYGQVATFMPEDGGYASFLHGKVVDMFYFPIIETVWPSWVPIWGGQEFIFFKAIFNVADSCVCVGAFIIILFYRKTFAASLAKEKNDAEAKISD